MTSLIGAIDQGTTSTRFVLVDAAGRFVSMAQREHRQIYPRPGWVEHDAAEIWENTNTVIADAMQSAGAAPEDVLAVGMTNQRETTVMWDAATGAPIAPAIVWQDTRTDDLCRALGDESGPDRYRDKTGLPLATYFSGPKIAWMLDNVPGAARGGREGTVLAGTMDSYLAWRLTGRHVTDVTNASRTMLMGLESLAWDHDVLADMNVPVTMLPEIVPSVGSVGHVRGGPLAGVHLAGILGDQQAAMFGQACFADGDTKNTYGTGCFMLHNTGTRIVQSRHGLLTTVAYQIGTGKARYALEGSIAIAGAGVQWLRDNLGLIDDASSVESLASGVEDNGGVYFVPAFSGLFAPYWRSDARGVITGLTRYANAGHLARAVLEATAYQTKDVLDAMRADSGAPLDELRVDGGMVANELLMQFQADVLGVPVVRPRETETTVLGAAYAAGLAVGFWRSLDELRAHWSEDRRWEPSMDPGERDRLHGSWNKAVERSFGWVD